MGKHRFFKTYSSFFDFLKNVKSELILISPFIKVGALRKLLENVQKDIKIIVVCRWRISDIVMGISDLDIYNFLKERNCTLFINNDIHLKTLMKDKKEIIVGSTNITNAGLGFSKKSNIEAITIDDVNSNDIWNVMKIIKSSILIDDILFEKFLNEVSKYDNIKEKVKINITKMNSFNKKIFTTKYKNLLVLDFPFYISPQKFIEDYKNGLFELDKMKHDLKLFNLSEKENVNNLYSVLRKRFLGSDVFKWQSGIVNDKILFGKYSEVLHNALTDDPRPYRKRVKELVRNMFNWTAEFSEDLEIKKYNYTSSLKKR